MTAPTNYTAGNARNNSVDNELYSRHDFQEISWIIENLMALGADAFVKNKIKSTYCLSFQYIKCNWQLYQIKTTIIGKYNFHHTIQ